MGPEFGTSSGKPRVAFNLDGVYLPRSTTSSAIMSDLERIDVLRGPQGTCMDATCIKQYAELAPGERVVIMCLATDRAHVGHSTLGRQLASTRHDYGLDGLPRQ